MVRHGLLQKRLISELLILPQYLCARAPIPPRFFCDAAPLPSPATSPTPTTAEVQELGNPKVAVFWDLDNKPPRHVPPYEAALRLKDMAAGFGEVVEMVAYANRHAFSHLPYWVKQSRRDRKMLDTLEEAGVVKPEEPYVCGYCGRKCRTNEKLKKHFVQLHQRERNKRLNRMDSLKGNRRLKYKASLAEKEERYRNAAREVLVPKVGYGLASELKRAGVYVRTVGDRPQAADEALKLHISKSIKQGIRCICLVSDDSDFSSTLQKAQSSHLHTVVVGDTVTLSRFADIRFSWQDVASGIALARANEVFGQWSSEEGMVREYLEDRYERSMGGGFQENGEIGDTDSSEEEEEEDSLWDATDVAPRKRAILEDHWWFSDDDYNDGK